MEDWSIVTDEITPDNLLKKFGNPPITTVASCLDLLTEYNQKYGAESPVYMIDEQTKVYLRTSRGH